ncbi:MAG: polyprenyl synthetase family protein [Kiritimatiellia bacterium]
MLTYFQNVRPGVARAIGDILTASAPRLAAISPMGAQLAARLDSYAQSGKMIRGILVRLGYELCAPEAPDAAMDRVLDRAGAAMEFLQAGLLIHDDIMDRDVLRRGNTTVHAQYEQDAKQSQAADPAHHGVSLGVCAGDVAFFLGFHVLAALPVPPGLQERARRVAAFSAEELCWVGVAQMQDVRNGAGGIGSDPDPAQILRVYRYKTGRYTFSLPLVIGAMLADGGPAHVEALDQAGENLGVVFQLKDDELGIFGDAAQSGKRADSDIREDKKTLLRHFLFAAADEPLRAKLAAVFGSREPGDEGVRFVREAMEATGARAKVREYMNCFAMEASDRIASLPPQTGLRAQSAREAFRELFRYSVERRA